MDEISEGILARFDSGVAERIVDVVVDAIPSTDGNIANVLNATILRRARRATTDLVSSNTALHPIFWSH